ncbi:MAG: hypothetical protein A3H33_14745 [Betaproteobacteria bacterium RIFCSPLOWO2_02_FULL_65_20]|nr:MAG: hypothetical protein A3H33_14745 [Betaproteobacteria bacterium RIFCSPLOWO2_02_FULL_65_20]
MPDGGAGGDGSRHTQEAGPQPFGIGIAGEHGVRIGIEHEPVAASDLGLELARSPAAQPGVEADALRRAVQQFIQRRVLQREENAWQHGYRIADALLRAIDRDQSRARHRSAEEHRLGEPLEPLAGENRRERPVGRAVDDHPCGLAALALLHQHHRFAEVRIGESGLGHQENSALAVRGGRRRYPQQHGQQRGEPRGLDAIHIVRPVKSVAPFDLAFIDLPILRSCNFAKSGDEYKSQFCIGSVSA